MPRTIHVEVTQEIIDQHGAALGDREDCPGFHALRAADIAAEDCGVSYFYVEDVGEPLLLPEEFSRWQRDGMDAQRQLHIDPDGYALEGPSPTDEQLAAVLQLISFDVELPE